MFNFEIKPQITKELLLSKYSEETYMSHYLGLPVKKGLFRSPLRKDVKPTASFYRNRSGELIFKDFGSDFYGNFVSVVMYKYSCTYHEALNIIAEDFGIISSKSNHQIKIKPCTTKFVDNGPSKIQIERKPFSNEELAWWKAYGIDEKILKKFDVYSCKSVFLNGNLNAQSNKACPIYGYYFGKEGDRELWRCYFPNRKTYRFLSNTSGKKIQGFHQLPKEGEVLVITKSQKDVMTLFSLGITAIAPNSEVLFLDDDVLEKLKQRFKYIFVMYDNDLAGFSNMNKIKKEHPELNYIWLPRKYAKDISDFHKKYGRDKTKILIRNFVRNNKLKFKCVRQKN